MNIEGLCAVAREIYVTWQGTFILCSVILSYSLKMCYKVIVCLMCNFK